MVSSGVGEARGMVEISRSRPRRGCAVDGDLGEDGGWEGVEDELSQKNSRERKLEGVCAGGGV